MITRLQSVLPERPVRPAPAPADTIIVIVHYDEQNAVRYWGSQGWTAERAEASEFSTWSAANLERKRARHAHPSLRVTLQGSWMTGGES